MSDHLGEYHYGSSFPCCLEVISCDDYDSVFKGFENGAILGVAGGKMDMLGGTIGEHQECPKNASEAYRLIQGK